PGGLDSRRGLPYGVAPSRPRRRDVDRPRWRASHAAPCARRRGGTGRPAGGAAAPRSLAERLGRDTPIAYTFIAPAFFLLLFLVAYPFVLSLWFSLSDARVGDTGPWIGPTNCRHTAA